MNIKDEFKEIINFTEIYGSSGVIDECEKITEKFAIDFAEWLLNDWTNDERWSKITEPKELLQIFKKEKGL